MMDGFDLESPLVCEGIIGDGCGGGRIFYVEDETLYAYYAETDEKTELLSSVKNVKSISKKGCIITLVCENETMEFDLSALLVVKKYKV